MAYVHSLVKMELNGKKGWCAPAELGEAAPHYVSFVVPLDERGNFLQEYTCETVSVNGRNKRIGARQLVRQGDDSFVLRLPGFDLWFALRTVPKEERRLQFIGRLGHPDFASRFVEIEAEEPAMLDRLFEEQSTFVIGCEPFSHYSGIEHSADLAADPASAGK